ALLFASSRSANGVSLLWRVRFWVIDTSGVPSTSAAVGTTPGTYSVVSMPCFAGARRRARSAEAWVAASDGAADATGAVSGAGAVTGAAPLASSTERTMRASPATGGTVVVPGVERGFGGCAASGGTNDGRPAARCSSASINARIRGRRGALAHGGTKAGVVAASGERARGLRKTSLAGAA